VYTSVIDVLDADWIRRLRGEPDEPRSDGEPPLPGPSQKLGLLQALAMAHDPLGFFEAFQLRYGDIFELPFGTALARNAWVCDPFLAREVIESEPPPLEAALTNALVEPVVGAGSLLLLAGEEHRRRREELEPEFDASRLRLDAGLITEEITRHLENWEAGNVIGLWKWAQQLTAAIMLRVVFGIGRGSAFDELSTAVREVVELAHNPAMLMPWLQIDAGPLSPWGKFLRQKAQVDQLLEEQIRKRRGDPTLDERMDILSLMVRTNLHDGDVRDEVLTLLIAGNQTTAAGLTWTLELLLRNPAKLAKLRGRLRKCEGRYLESVVTEALRLRVPLFALGRGTQAEYQLGPFTIPAGMGIAIPLLLVYRSPGMFKDPTVFRPERFEPPEPAPGTWVPFGDGIRKCIGWHFALLQIGMIVEAVVNRFDLRLMNERPARPKLMSGALVIPDTDVPVRVTVRRASG